MRPPTTRPPELRVLVVDPDAALRRSLARALLASGLEVSTAEGQEAARLLLHASKLDVVLGAADELDGLFDELRASRPAVQAVVSVAPGDTEGLARAVAEGAFAVVPRAPEHLESLLLAVRRAGQHRRQEQRILALQRQLGPAEDLDALVGATPAMRELFRAATQLAELPMPLTLVGEPGSGKRSLAQAIHRQGPRAEAPFVVLDLGAFEGEEAPRAALFGGQEGPGALERADEGTLALARIGALSPPAQGELASYLAGQGRTEPLLVGRARAPRARVLLLAEEEPRLLAKRGDLTPELLRQLSVLVLRIPPLRLRRDDIPLLVHHVARRVAARLGRPPPRLGTEALRLLRAHDWPGNVSELEAVVEHAVTTGPAESLFASALPPSLRGEATKSGLVGGATEATTFLAPGLVELDYASARQQAALAFEAWYSAALLARVEGNVNEAARRAGMDASNFRRILRRLKGPGRLGRRGVGLGVEEEVLPRGRGEGALDPPPGPEGEEQRGEGESGLS